MSSDTPITDHAPVARPSQRWSVTRRVDAGIHHTRASFFRDALKPHIQRGQSMLDVGAGDGVLASMLRDELDLKVRAVDIEARELADLKVEVYDGLHLPLDDKSVDCTICVAVLHHCNDPMAVLREIRRVTRSRFLLVEDLFDSAWDRTCVIGFHHYLNWIESMPFRRDGFASRADWQKRLESTGFRVIETRLIGKAVRAFPVINTLTIAEPV